MISMSLKEVLKKIQEELSQREQVRESAQRDMRTATRLSKQAIQVIHQDRFDDAKKNAVKTLLHYQVLTKFYLLIITDMRFYHYAYIYYHTIIQVLLVKLFPHIFISTNEDNKYDYLCYTWLKESLPGHKLIINFVF